MPEKLAVPKSKEEVENEKVRHIIEAAGKQKMGWLSKVADGPVLALLDASGSMQDYIPAAQLILTKASMEAEGRGKRFYLKTFSETASDIVSNEGGTQKIAKALYDVGQKGGSSTRTAQALDSALDWIKGKGAQEGAWTILLVTDAGWDNDADLDGAARPAMKNKLKQNNIALVSVMLGPEESNTIGSFSDRCFRVARDGDLITLKDGPMDIETGLAVIRERIGADRVTESLEKDIVGAVRAAGGEKGGIKAVNAEANEERMMQGIVRLVRQNSGMFGEKGETDSALWGSDGIDLMCACPDCSKDGAKQPAVTDAEKELPLLAVVCRSISRYGGSVAIQVVDEFASVVKSGMKQRDIRVLAKALGSDALVECAGRYSDGIATKLLGAARAKVYNNWYDTGNTKKGVDVVEKMAKAFSDEDVVKLVNKCGPEDFDSVHSILRKVGAIYNESGSPARELLADLSNMLEKRGGKSLSKLSEALELMGDAKAGDVSRMIGLFGRAATMSLIAESMDANTIARIVKDGLDDLVTDGKSLEAVQLYMGAKGELPKPTRESIGNYEGAVQAHMREKYGLEKKLSIEQVLLLMNWMRDNAGSGRDGLNVVIKIGVMQVINRSAENGVRYYSTGDGGQITPVDYQRDELVRYAVTSLTGAGEDGGKADAVLSLIVGDKEVRKGRNTFNSKYKHLRQKIIGMVKSSDYGAAADALRQTGNEDIITVLGAADYRDTPVGNIRLIRASESKNPLDYDQHVQIACVYMPSSNVFGYCTDDRAVLVKYEIGGKAVGSAICYMEDGKFLVDSVEGHRTFRKPEAFNVVYDDLLSRAMARGATQMVFNRNTPNETAKGFLKMLEDRKVEQKTVKMRLDCPNLYIEARREGVSAFVVDLHRKEEQPVVVKPIENKPAAEN